MRKKWMHFVWAYRVERFFGASVWKSLRFAIAVVRYGEQAISVAAKPRAAEPPKGGRAFRRA